MTTKPVLAFDCAGLSASVALCVQGATHEQHIAQASQAVELVPVMHGLMQTHGVAYSQLQCIITTIGPGSFTGIRIGLATLHGLVMACPTPIKLLTSLAAMAWEVAARAHAPGHFIVILRAGKGEVYAQEFVLKNEHPQEAGDIFLALENKADWHLPCFGNVSDIASPHYIAAPSAAILCRIADYVPNAILSEALPCYIRPPDAKIPATAAWLT